VRRHVGFGVEGGGQTAGCYGRLIIPVDISQPAHVLFKTLMNWANVYTPVVKILYARMPRYRAR